MSDPRIRRKTRPVARMSQEQLEPEMLPTDFLQPPHEVRDKTKIEKLTRDMQRHGWRGGPLVGLRAQGWLLTGSHRIKAARAAGLEEVPFVDIVDVFRESGKDFEAILRAYGNPSYGEYSFADMIERETPPDAKERYGIDVQA